jgi:DNA topoisomerase-1
MAKGLLVVESPAKATTLKRYLGKDIAVLACMGHIKNLPKSKLGVDVENGYKAEFVTIKGKANVLKELKAAAKKVDNIYLAPDPDREGEAIAAHLAEEIGGKGKTVYRVLFNEITKKAVLEAMKNVGQINVNKVNAQMARRILDRLVGYKISPLLWEKVRKGLSAGRVQSVAMRLIVEREKEVRAFVPKEYWTIDGKAESSTPPPFEVRLAHYKGEKIEIGSAEDASKATDAIRSASLVITRVEKKERKRHPYAPFITSSLQQDASRKLRFAAKRTMSVAQRLYEGLEVGEEGPVGLITYMRTDSTRVSDDAITEAREFIGKELGAAFLPAQPIVYKTSKSAQDAHEAIRPTSVERTPDKLRKYLPKEEMAVYELVWKRFVASQMSSAVFDVTSVDISAGEYTLRATGSIMKFAGFLKLYEETKEMETDTGDDADKRLPSDLAEGLKLTLIEITPNQHFTQPPPRYTEATLIRELEEKGVGRPSTYAGILDVIQEREYCEAQDRKLTPTELGMLVTDLIVESFPDIVNVEFTAQMEGELDQVEEGKKSWTEALDDFYKPFVIDLEKAKTTMRNVRSEAEKTDVVCEKCGKPMVIKFGRFGKFMACAGYPECKNTKKLDKEGGVVEKPEAIPDEPTDGVCEKCGSPMVIKTGRFGRYIACSRYPECKTTKQIGIGIMCPKPGCGGELGRKRTKKGKTFYGCSNYATTKCDFAVWDEPILEPCPLCAHPFLVKKNLKTGSQIKCPNKECAYKRDLEVDEPAA